MKKRKIWKSGNFRRIGVFLAGAGLWLPCGPGGLRAQEEASVEDAGIRNEAMEEPPLDSGDRERSEQGESAGIRSLLDSFDLESGSLDWKGKNFDLGDVRMARARFEKYLNAPAATTEEDLAYDAILEDINRRLIGRGDGTETELLAQAWRMLYEASEFPIDAGLSETLAERVVSFWRTSQKIRELLWENQQLETELELNEVDIRIIQSKDRDEFIDMTRGKSRPVTPPPSRDFELDPLERQKQETLDALEENRNLQIATRVSQRLEFQSLILQFFTQRRFQHAIIANHFYRYIFGDQDATLEGAESLKGQIFGDLDVRMTTSSIDAVAKEAMADVEEGIQTVRFLLDRGEVHSASQRLMETFYLGEYLPPVKTLPVEEKRRVLTYLRDLSKLANALEVRSFDRADSILAEISGYAADFDPGRPSAFIDTSRQMSDLAVQKALVAAKREDMDGVEEALNEAVSIWPTNPAIGDFSRTMLERTDEVDVATSDFDRYVAQEDYRAIFRDRFRFAAALATDEERNAEFLDIMKRMEAIEAAMSQAKELARIENDFGAWEVLERAYRSYPNDQELNRLRGDFAVRASEFAFVVSKAERAQEEGRIAEALNAYLDAAELYPASYFAQEGQARVVGLILDARAPSPLANVSGEPDE